MERKPTLSIYIPQDKLRDRPIERITELAKQRDRSVNHVVVAAILEYLDQEEPLEDSFDKESRHVGSSSGSSMNGNQRGATATVDTADSDRTTSKKDTHVENMGTELEKKVRAEAEELAEKIRHGEETAEVRWHDQNTAHVMISHVFLPDSGIKQPLNEYRTRLQGQLVEILAQSGWEAQPRNRFVRHGPAEEWRGNGSQRRVGEDTTADHEGRRSSEASRRSRAGNRFSLVLPIMAFTVLVAIGAITENAGYMMIGAALLIVWVAARYTGKS